ncbi:hypothetical protein [Azotobacter beijerinckii]|uniref:Uncharacterized protein n=1 Tax=Azotobacter beijerinckii TaxID=170623 RepID=A0A1I1BCR5_9GAMM|nr:hypothetical protein [Azotobacter beijerinckii]SFB46320.1 hypothetical protein SAMN04244571_02996 [Azotobacter beijerinckii]
MSRPVNVIIDIEKLGQDGWQLCINLELPEGATDEDIAEAVAKEINEREKWKDGE